MREKKRRVLPRFLIKRMVLRLEPQEKLTKMVLLLIKSSTDICKILHSCIKIYEWIINMLLKVFGKILVFVKGWFKPFQEREFVSCSRFMLDFRSTDGEVWKRILCRYIREYAKVFLIWQDRISETVFREFAVETTQSINIASLCAKSLIPQLCRENVQYKK